jgi:hypothetical protein
VGFRCHIFLVFRRDATMKRPKRVCRSSDTRPADVPQRGVKALS